MRAAFVFLIILCSPALYAAKTKNIDLVVAYKTVNFAGKSRQAITVNNVIPGPTLHFKEGETVAINVHNRLDKETAIHWHGVLVPWQMDGVLGLSQKGIPPGGTFQYKFKLLQSGTYWYHAHAGLQEQQGLYGAFVIDPIKRSSYHYTKDYVVVLSDWSNTNPNQIMANLKKEGDYYSPRFPLQPSLSKFIHDYRNASPIERVELVNDYKMMQQMRMNIYDISDVVYDAFLLNGKTRTNPWTASVRIGDVVRLRLIGAGASTIFHVKIPGTSMQMVQVDGNDIKPHEVKDFTVAPGETYDVLVKIKHNKPYVIYAESIDTVGSVIGVLKTSLYHQVDYQLMEPFSEPPPVTREMMINMHQGMSMHHHPMKMTMPTESLSMGDVLSPPTSHYNTTPNTGYQRLVAAVKTNDPNKPVTKTIKMELFGYMDRFIWFINGVPEYNAKPIILEPGKRYRFIFTNTSMMHHPMHIHGHWFILRKGNGEYDPLLHTIDVPPGATMTADVDTEASGQWFFHCHLLYHMVAGMARVVQYNTLLEITNNDITPAHIINRTAYHNRPMVRVGEVRPIDASLVMHPMPHEAGFWLSSYVDVGVDPFRQIQKITYKGLYGPDYNKIELFTDDAEINQGAVENADIDIFYWHLLSQFWAVKGGVNYFYRPAVSPYWQPGVGIEGLMPYFIGADLRGYYYSGSAKLDAELLRDTQITNNFFIRLAARAIFATKTVERASLGSGLNQMRYIIRPYHRIFPGINGFIEYEYQKDYGAFRNQQQQMGEHPTQSSLTFGFTALL